MKTVLTDCLDKYKSFKVRPRAKRPKSFISISVAYGAKCIFVEKNEDCNKTLQADHGVFVASSCLKGV